MKKAVFFDLYGTLIDIRTDEYDHWVYEMLSRYLAYHSVSISAEELKRAYFEGIQWYLNHSRELYPEADVYKVFYDIMNKYGKKRYSRGIVVDIAMLFRSLTIRNFGIFNGCHDVLISLSKKYKIALISDAQWVFSEPEMSKLGLAELFKVKILSSRFGYKKPDARLFHAAMEKLGVLSGDSVYIGDNPNKDLLGAKKAGLKCILFQTECRDYNGFQPDTCFADYSELENKVHDLMYAQ